MRRRMLRKSWLKKQKPIYRLFYRLTHFYPFYIWVEDWWKD